MTLPIDFAAIIDIVTSFIITLIVTFVAYKLLAQDTSFDENKEKRLALRLNTISKSQDMLLESAAGERVSTFSKLEQQRVDESASQHTMRDRIIITMRKAGINDMSVNTFVVLCSIGGAAMSTIIIYFKFLNIITGLPIGMGVGAYLVFNFLASRAATKKMEFLTQFPDAIDMMIRGVKAGLNIARIIKLVSIEAKDPIASEYRTISQKMELGMEPEKVLVDAADRIDIEEFRFLVVALVLQMENGGVLGEILANLSGIVRKRLELGLKLKAMSAEARMSAIVISALPFVFAGIMAVLNPAHLKEFLAPGSGQTLLKITITLFAMGAFFMLKATNIKV